MKLGEQVSQHIKSSRPTTIRSTNGSRTYGAVREVVARAVEAYAADVRSGAFPGAGEMHSFKSNGAATSGD